MAGRDPPVLTSVPLTEIKATSPVPAGCRVTFFAESKESDQRKDSAAPGYRICGRWWDRGFDRCTLESVRLRRIALANGGDSRLSVERLLQGPAVRFEKQNNFASLVFAFTRQAFCFVFRAGRQKDLQVNVRVTVEKRRFLSTKVEP